MKNYKILFSLNMVSPSVAKIFKLRYITLRISQPHATTSAVLQLPKCRYFSICYNCHQFVKLSIRQVVNSSLRVTVVAAGIRENFRPESTRVYIGIVPPSRDGCT